MFLLNKSVKTNVSWQAMLSFLLDEARIISCGSRIISYIVCVFVLLGGGTELALFVFDGEWQERLSLGTLGIESFPAYSGQVCHPLAPWQCCCPAAFPSTGLSGCHPSLVVVPTWRALTHRTSSLVPGWRPFGVC